MLTIGPFRGLREDAVNGVRVLRVGIKNLYANAAIGIRPPAWKRALWHLADIYNPLMKTIVSDVLRLVQPDVANLHNVTGFSISAWNAISEARLPMVQVLHDQYLLCPRSVMFRNDHLCERQCLSCHSMRYFHPQLSNQVNAVVGVSKFVLEHHLRHGYFRLSPVKRVIHNAQANSAALNVPSRRPDSIVRFGFIGNLAQNKGIELLLDVFKESARSHWQLHIAGRGHARYENYLREWYAGPNIIFKGVQKPGDFYPNIDFLVVPSICNDSLATVVYEALSYGLPVIGSRRGGMPEMIKDGVNGLLFDPNNPSELVTAMAKVAGDTAFRASSSLAARDTSKYFFDMDRFLSSYENLMSDLC